MVRNITAYFWHGSFKIGMQDVIISLLSTYFIGNILFSSEIILKYLHHKLAKHWLT